MNFNDFEGYFMEVLTIFGDFWGFLWIYIAFFLIYWRILTILLLIYGYWRNVSIFNDYSWFLMDFNGNIEEFYEF